MMPPLTRTRRLELGRLTLKITVVNRRLHSERLIEEVLGSTPTTHPNLLLS